MKSDSLKTILAEIATESVPATEVDLWPALQRELLTGEFRPPKGVGAMRGTIAQKQTWRYAMLATLVMMILAFFIFLLTPKGRAWAQEIFGYFNTTDQTWFQLEPTPTPLTTTFALPMSMVTPKSTPAADTQQCGLTISPLASTFPCQLLAAEGQLGFAVKSFAATDGPLVFQMMRLRVDEDMVTMIFDDPATGVVYTLAQGEGDFPAMTGTVPESAVEQVTVGDYPAEYVPGGFVPGGDGRAAYWETAFPLRELRWRENGRWFALSASLGMLEESRFKEQLITLAANLVALSEGSGKLAGAADLPLTERVAFALKEPTVLPDGFFFCGATYGAHFSPDPDSVVLRYCYEVDGRQVGTMRLYQTPATSAFDPFPFFVSSPAELVVNEAVQIGAQPGKYLVEVDGHTGLIWAQDGHKMMLETSWSPTYGARLEKEVLLAVAENLHAVVGNR